MLFIFKNQFLIIAHISCFLCFFPFISLTPLSPPPLQQQRTSLSPQLMRCQECSHSMTFLWPGQVKTCLWCIVLGQFLWSSLWSTHQLALITSPHPHSGPHTSQLSSPLLTLTLVHTPVSSHHHTTPHLITSSHCHSGSLTW